jgi:putative phosphoribosyl transferase
MIFRDRSHAGVSLAKELNAYRGDPTVVILALPRGGVVVGYEISRMLRFPLDVFITRKLVTPDNPEYAIGAVSETGAIYLNPDAVDAFHLSHDDLEGLIQAQRHEIARRQALYRQGRPLPALADRTVILVDDGIATGSTFFATIEAVTELSLGRLIAAIPVGPHETLTRVKSLVDELVVLEMPDPFSAVGEAYQDFTQVEDAQVVALLKAAHDPLRPQSSPSQA